MSHPDFNDIQVCVFDAYGTLFDVHSVVHQHKHALGNIADRFSSTWRSKQLEYSWLISLMNNYVDFWQLTEDALDYAMDTFDLGDMALRSQLLDSYRQIAAYPQVPKVLDQLQDRGMKLAIFSNATSTMLASALTSNGLSSYFDAVISVDPIKTYKPDPKAYAFLASSLGIDPRHISYHSANSFDAFAASRFGFKTSWINRQRQRPERLPKQPQATLNELSELVALLSSQQTAS